MKCPVDDAELVMTERQGVEIDYCPTCRGVWLDRGELDKILDRSVPAPPPAAAPVPPPPEPRCDRPREPYRDDDRYRDQHRDQHRDQYGRPYKKRKESWLGEIFDF